MLEASNKVGSGGSEPVTEQSDELRALLVASREERGALSSILTQIEAHASTVSQVAKALQQVNERAAWVTAKLEELRARLVGLESRTVGFEQVETRIRSLVDSVTQAEQRADKLLRPEGELQQHRQAVQQLSSEVIQTKANLEALKKEQPAVDQLREHVRQAQTELNESVERTAALKNGFDQLRSIAIEVQQEHDRIRDALRQTRGDAHASTEAVRDVERKLGTLSPLSRTTEERLAVLNSLVEHALQKVKVLENQKHTVEHAVVESNRLTEMVWNMDVQIAKLHEGAKQVAQADETIARLERVAAEIALQFEQAKKGRDEFAQELAKIEKGRAQLTDFLRSHMEQLALQRNESESFLRRVEEFRGHLPELDSRIDAITSKLPVVEEGTFKAATLVAIADGLERHMTRIEGHQQFVEKIDARLDDLNALSASVDKKLDEQLARRAEFESLKSLCDGLGVQISEAHQKLEAVSGLQQKGLPLTAQVATLKMQPDKTAPAYQMEQQEEAQIAAQQKRLGELMAARRALAAAVDERLTQVHSLAGELGRRTALKDELVQELARLQGWQRDVATQAVIDHVVESMARLGEITQTAQATLKGLETERDLAERIEGNIKQLRARTASGSSERLA